MMQGSTRIKVMQHPVHDNIKVHVHAACWPLTPCSPPVFIAYNQGASRNECQGGIPGIDSQVQVVAIARNCKEILIPGQRDKVIHSVHVIAEICKAPRGLIDYPTLKCMMVARLAVLVLFLVTASEAVVSAIVWST
jgi:hypothetical protein